MPETRIDKADADYAGVTMRCCNCREYLAAMHEEPHEHGMRPLIHSKTGEFFGWPETCDHCQQCCSYESRDDDD